MKKKGIEFQGWVLNLWIILELLYTAYKFTVFKCDLQRRRIGIPEKLKIARGNHCRSCAIVQDGKLE